MGFTYVWGDFSRVLIEGDWNTNHFTKNHPEIIGIGIIGSYTLG